MSMFRRKSDVVEARQFDGEPSAEFELWLGDAFETWLPSQHALVIKRAGVEHEAVAGDWVIRGLAGDCLVVKPALFEALYEPADEKPPTDG